MLALGVPQSGETLLCCRSDGEPHQPLSLTYEFTRFMHRLKDLPRVRFHDLRHTHATQLLATGVHPKIASERLGHASVGITLDLYSHVTETMQGEARQSLTPPCSLRKVASQNRNSGARVANSVASNILELAALPIPIKCQAVTATWRSGYAAVCKTAHPGSIPGVASST